MQAQPSIFDSSSRNDMRGCRNAACINGSRARTHAVQGFRGCMSPWPASSRLRGTLACVCADGPNACLAHSRSTVSVKPACLSLLLSARTGTCPVRRYLDNYRTVHIARMSVQTVCDSHSQIRPSSTSFPPSLTKDISRADSRSSLRSHHPRHTTHLPCLSSLQGAGQRPVARRRRQQRHRLLASRLHMCRPGRSAAAPHCRSEKLCRSDRAGA